MFLQERENARGHGDRGVERCMDVELDRMGHRDHPVETTEQEQLERAVPAQPKRRGRPPKPRCEHDMLVERCPECSEGGT
jgi:hypothetical protein